MYRLPDSAENSSPCSPFLTKELFPRTICQTSVEDMAPRGGPDECMQEWCGAKSSVGSHECGGTSYQNKLCITNAPACASRERRRERAVKGPNEALATQRQGLGVHHARVHATVTRTCVAHCSIPPHAPVGAPESDVQPRPQPRRRPCSQTGVQEHQGPADGGRQGLGGACHQIQGP